jgi:DnaJ-class molecular chaperone
MNSYKVLGIAPTDDKMAIRRAYVTAAKMHHPDTGGSAEQFKIVQAAYNDLINNKLDDIAIETELSLDLADFLFGCTATAILKHGIYRGTVLEFKVPPLTYPGATIEFHDSGSTHKQVRVKLNAVITEAYIRIDANIVIRHTINILDAELGTTLNLTNFDGTIHTVKISPETTADRLIYTIADAGFYDRKTKQRGTLTIIVEVNKKRYTNV